MKTSAILRSLVRAYMGRLIASVSVFAVGCGGPGTATGGAPESGADGVAADARTPSDSGGFDARAIADVADAENNETAVSDVVTGTDAATRTDSGLRCTISPRPAGSPALTPGTWKNITPPAIDLVNHFGTPEVDIDPCNPSTLYLCADTQGLWKSTDGGSNWAVLGTPGSTGWPTTHYLDSPIRAVVDPNNPLHLYATQGVRGVTGGFWVSTDGGNTWTAPAGFQSAATMIGTRDVTQFDVDPTDFNHVLVGSHQAWSGLGLANAGILETTDGGATFVVHRPVPSWGVGSMGLRFLFKPGLGIGNSQTWLVATDGNGSWRTSDSGAHWTQVNAWGCPHGGVDIYYTSTGVLYAGGYQYPQRSTDNGVTWTQVTGGLPYSWYFTLQGDGQHLYTMQSGACQSNCATGPYWTSAESDGLTWTRYQGGTQLFSNGPFVMRFDSINRIMYSANWDGGLWALAVLP